MHMLQGHASVICGPYNPPSEDFKQGFADMRVLDCTLRTPQPRGKVGRLTSCLFLSVAMLAACGGGGSDNAPSPGPSDPPAGGPPPAPPAASPQWLSTAPNFELYGTADSGIDGALKLVNVGDAANTLALDPNPVNTTIVRIHGGEVDATQTALRTPRATHLVWDQAGPNGVTTLQTLSLITTGGAKPQVRRVSNETRICPGVGGRFEVIGQSLQGDEATLVYNAPDAQGQCGAHSQPRLAMLSMDATAAPVVLPSEADTRLTPIAPVHGANGKVAAYLAWRGNKFVRTDARLGNVVELPAEGVSEASAPLGPGFVTRFGIFVRSADGLRRYDKSTERMSSPLVEGRIGQGTAIDAIADERALHVSTLLDDGTINLYRIEDLLVPRVQLLNIDGSLRPAGFRLLRDQVLYALAGREDWTAWSKQTGSRSNVLAGHNIVLASSLHNTVFTQSLNAQGAAELGQSQFDGSQRRALPATTLMGGGLHDEVAPYARTNRRNAAFSQALVVSTSSTAPMGEVRWLSFADTSTATTVGAFPTNLSTEAAWQSAGVLGANALIGLKKTGSSAHELFALTRGAGLTRVVAP
jgi:hypothetical protein